MLRRIVVASGLWVVTAAGAADPNPFLELLPELKTAAAPDWVRQGVRLTYYSATASIPADRHLYYRDEQGGWVDQFGNRYGQEETASASGCGFTQVDIATVRPDAAVLAVRSFGLVNGAGPLVPLGAASAIGLPGAGADYWLSPAVLAKVRPVPVGETRIVPMPYAVDGKTYQAIRFQVERPDAQQVWVFDLASGVLLYGGTATTGVVSAGRVTEQGGPGTSKMLTITVFKGFRALDLPWLGGAPAEALTTLQRLRYRGSHAVVIPGSPVLPLAAQTDVQVLDKGPAWVRFSQRDAVGVGNSAGVPPTVTESVRVAGPGQIGGIWLPAAALPGLRAGQTIDTDPLTGITTTVVQNGQGPNGRALVVLREAAPAFQIDYYYDVESGLMFALAFQDRVLNQMIQMELASAE